MYCLFSWKKHADQECQSKVITPNLHDETQSTFPHSDNFNNCWENILIKASYAQNYAKQDFFSPQTLQLCRLTQKRLYLKRKFCPKLFFVLRGEDEERMRTSVGFSLLFEALIERFPLTVQVTAIKKKQIGIQPSSILLNKKRHFYFCPCWHWRFFLNSFIVKTIVIRQHVLGNLSQPQTVAENHRLQERKSLYSPHQYSQC